MCLDYGCNKLEAKKEGMYCNLKEKYINDCLECEFIDNFFKWNKKQLKKAFRISLIKWNFNLIFSDLMDFSKYINSFIITRNCGFCKESIKRSNFNVDDVFNDKCEHCIYEIKQVCEYIDDYDVGFLDTKESYLKGCKNVIKKLIKIRKELIK